MAKKRHRRKRASLSSPPTHRRKRTTTRRRKRRGLSDNFLSMQNPLIGGLIGGGVGMIVDNVIPNDVASKAGILPNTATKGSASGSTGMSDTNASGLIKSVLLVTGAFFARKKFPFIAAGMAASAVKMGGESLGLGEPGKKYFRKGKFANPNLLKEDIALYDSGTGRYFAISENDMLQLNESLLLSGRGEQSPYSDYQVMQDNLLMER